MPRCRSWKPRANRSDMGTPGTDRALWEPCRARTVEPGTSRCRDCWEALVDSRDVKIRRMVAEETPLPEWVRERLAADVDIAVRDKATGGDFLSGLFVEQPFGGLFDEQTEQEEEDWWA